MADHQAGKAVAGEEGVAEGRRHSDVGADKVNIAHVEVVEDLAEEFALGGAGLHVGLDVMVVGRRLV